MFDFPCDGLHDIGVTSADSSVSGRLLERLPSFNQLRPIATMQYAFAGVVDCSRGVAVSTVGVVILDVPLRYLVPRLPFEALIDVALHHGLRPFGSSWSSEDLVSNLLVLYHDVI